MHLQLDLYVAEEKAKETAKALLGTEKDIVAIEILKDVRSIGDLEKLKAFIKCQKRDFGYNFSNLALFISTIILVLTGVEKIVPQTSTYSISIGIFILILGLSLVISIFHHNVPLVSNINHHNTKLEYLVWLIDEEIYRRKLIDDGNVGNKQTIKNSVVGNERI